MSTDETQAPRPGEPGWSAVESLARAHADHRVTLAQIGRWRLLRISARSVVHDDKRGGLWFRVGPDHPHRKILVVLRADDLYAVEVGRLDIVDWLPTWISEGSEGVDQGLYADQLGEAIDRLMDEVS